MANSLIQLLNSHVGKTPDEIATAIIDPLAQWQSLTTGMCPELFDTLEGDTEIALYYHQGEERGYYCTSNTHMTSRWSYRTLDPAHAQPQRVEDYPPYDAQGTRGYYFIGWEYRFVVPPTVDPDPCHENWEYPDDDY